MLVPHFRIFRTKKAIYEAKTFLYIYLNDHFDSMRWQIRHIASINRQSRHGSVAISITDSFSHIYVALLSDTIFTAFPRTRHIRDLAHTLHYVRRFCRNYSIGRTV